MNRTLSVEIESVTSLLRDLDLPMVLFNVEGEFLNISSSLAEAIGAAVKSTIVPGINVNSLRQNVPKESVRLLELLAEGISDQINSCIIESGSANHYQSWEITFHHLTDNYGSRYILGLGTELTSLRNAEWTVVRQQKELTKLAFELDRFTYRASHDMRAPLMSIQGLVNILKVEDLDKASLALYLTHIETCIIKLNGFISSVVDYSTISQAEQKVRAIDFHGLLYEVIDRLCHLEEFGKVRVETFVDPKASLYCDYDQLKVIFLTILVNAYHFHDSTKDCFVRVKIVPEEYGIMLRFDDNGMGIARDHVHKVFGMFFRGNAKSRGSGLGLYLAKEAAEKLKGSIELISAVGVGTSVTVKLPNVLVR